MKEFVEKLISGLEELKSEVTSLADIVWNNAVKMCIDKANQLAEEYNNGWIPCSERLPEANQIVLTCDKDGWMSVNVNMPYAGVKNEFECGYYVAWMPLPEPYHKGE